MNIHDLWHSTDSRTWGKALERYWDFVQPRNFELEQKLNTLDLQTLKDLDSQGWYAFLLEEYFRWKYTAPNRYATTTNVLKKQVHLQGLDFLDAIRRQLLEFDIKDVLKGLEIAKTIPGLGTSGGSGLLSLMYPEHFATVDQFVVKALRQFNDLSEATTVLNMNPEGLKLSDGVMLIGILERKAKQNNLLFNSSFWTPRKIDMVLWTFGRN